MKKFPRFTYASQDPDSSPVRFEFREVPKLGTRELVSVRILDLNPAHAKLSMCREQIRKTALEHSAVRDFDEPSPFLKMLDYPSANASFRTGLVALVWPHTHRKDPKDDFASE